MFINIYSRGMYSNSVKTMAIYRPSKWVLWIIFMIILSLLKSCKLFIMYFIFFCLLINTIIDRNKQLFENFPFISHMVVKKKKAASCCHYGHLVLAFQFKMIFF